MNLDERARRAAASIREQVEGVDTDAVLDRIQGTAGRRRWLAPVAAAAGATAVVIAVVALVLPQLRTDRIEIGPDPVATADSEPTPGEVQTPARTGAGSWQRVTNDEAFGGPGDQEMRAVAASDGVTVAVGVDREQAAVWRSTGDVTDPTGWQRVANDLCGQASCELTDVTAAAPGFAAVGTLDGVPKVWLSPDGSSWERIDVDVSAQGQRRLTAVTTDDGGFAAFGSVTSDGEGVISRPIVIASRDGRTWTEEAVDFEFAEAGAHVEGAVDFDGRVLALTQVGDGSAILERDDTTWRTRELGPEFGTDIALRGLAVHRGALVLVAARFMGEDVEPAFWRSSDGLDWSPVDSGLRVGPAEQPWAAVSLGSTVMAVGETGASGGATPPHPAFWIGKDGGFQAMDGGPAFREPGRMLAVTATDRDVVVAVGEGGETTQGDAAVWTYHVGVTADAE